ncbi:MAG: hypothetical protein ACKOW9_00750 [Candidatus Paceibacterota bacterium]
MTTLSRLSTISLAVLLMTTATAAHGAAPIASKTKPAKSISLKAAQKMYREFTKVTNASMAKKSFKMTEESRTDGGPLELDSITVDQRGNAREIENGVTTLLVVGEKIYIAPREISSLAWDYELEIARDLGYQIDKNWSTVSGIDPKLVRSELRASAALDATLLSWFKAGLAKATWQPSSKDSKSGTLTVTQEPTQALASEVGFDIDIPARSIQITVESGKITAIIDKDEFSTVTTRFENYVKLINKPSGPIINFDNILSDDRYAAGWARSNAIAVLRTATREALAMAAFEGTDKVSSENWDISLRGNNSVRRTESGIEVRVNYPGWPVTNADQEFFFCAQDPTTWALSIETRPSVDQLVQGPCK